MAGVGGTNRVDRSAVDLGHLFDRTRLRVECPDRCLGCAGRGEEAAGRGGPVLLDVDKAVVRPVEIVGAPETLSLVAGLVAVVDDVDIAGDGLAPSQRAPRELEVDQVDIASAALLTGN